VQLSRYSLGKMAMSDLAITPLIRAAQGGCATSLGQLLEAYRPFLIAIARDSLDKELQAKASPSDLVQQTFVEAQRDIAQASLRGDDDLRAWLRRLLLNNIADFRQSYRRAKRAIRREQAAEEHASKDLLLNLIASDITSPSQGAARREEQDRVESALDRLSEEYRQVIIWRNREHLTIAEIAARLNRSSDAVRLLWCRAVQRLKKEIEREGGNA